MSRFNKPRKTGVCRQKMEFINTRGIQCMEGKGQAVH